MGGIKTKLHTYWKDIFNADDTGAQTDFIMNITELVEYWTEILSEEKEGEGDNNLVVYFEILNTFTTQTQIEHNKKHPIYVISKLANKNKQQYQDLLHPKNQLESVT